MSVKAAHLQSYLTVLLESFEGSDQLPTFIDNLSGGNIRDALGFVTDFVGSGHVDAQKIIDTYEASGSYLVPIHEFIRAVMYKDHEYYDPGVSRIANLFDISTPDGREHFLLPNILSLVQRSGSVEVDEGYIEISRIFDYAQGLGFSPLQIRFAIDRALAKKLLEANPRFVDTGAVTSVRLTTIGAYTNSHLCTFFTYIDAVLVDTPIVDEAARKAVAVAKNIEERLDRALRFIAYLDDQWQPLGSKSVAFDWSLVSNALKTEIERVRRRAASHSSR